MIESTLNGMMALEERSPNVAYSGSDCQNVKVENNSTCIMSSGEDGQELLLYDKEEASAKHRDRVALGERVVPFLRLNWRNLAAIVCLWISMLMVNTALSMISPFFPREVCTSLELAAY